MLKHVRVEAPRSTPPAGLPVSRLARRIALLAFCGLLAVTLAACEGDTKIKQKKLSASTGGGVSVPFIFGRISGGLSHSAAIKGDKSIFSWGERTYGQMGFGPTTTGNELIPVQESANFFDVVKVSSGWNHTLILRSDGTIWGWGDNSDGRVGIPANGVQNSPAQESTGNATWVDVAAGRFCGMGLRNDGTIWAWGNNFTGQLGVGDTTNRDNPTQEALGHTDWVAIFSAEDHMWAMKADGSIWATGQNADGQLCSGATGGFNSVFAQEITGATNWKAADGGAQYSILMKTDGTLYGCGYNVYGTLGTGDTATKTTPTQEATTSSTWTVFASGESHMLALRNDGSLWAWGRNFQGQVGDGTTVDVTTGPIQIGSDKDWRGIGAGSNQSLAIKVDGSLLGWGWGNHGQNGLGVLSDVPVPTQEATLATDWY